MRRSGLLLLITLASAATLWMWQQTRERAPSAAQTPLRPVPLRAQARPPAPDFIRESLDGRELALSELRGKPVVMNFWASWCVPCRLEMPTLEDAAKRYRGQVHFLGVNVLDPPEQAKAFVRDLGVTFPSVLDEDGTLLARYRIVGLPTTVFITGSGRILEVHAGPFVGEEGTKKLQRYLTRLLQEP